MNNILKNKEKEKELLEKGFTTMPLLSKEEVKFLLEGIYSLQPDGDFTQKDIDAPYITYKDSSAVADKEYRLKANQTVREILSKHVQENFIEQRIFTSSYFIKAPGVGFLPSHQHSPFVTKLDEKAFVVWCPLVDVNELNGTLHVLEGSHKIVPGLYPYDYPQFFADYGERVRKHSKPIVLKAGEALIFDDKLIHGSDVNNSSGPRIVAAGMTMPINARMVWYHFDKDNPGYFEALEIDDSFFINTRLTGLPLERPEGLKHLGYVKNENWKLSEKQFFSLLEMRKEMKIDINIQDDIPKLSNSLLNRVKGFFGKRSI